MWTSPWGRKGKKEENRCYNAEKENDIAMGLHLMPDHSQASKSNYYNNMVKKYYLRDNK
jgi:hypothetical protein